MGWIDTLRGSVVGLDTAPLIYFTEGDPTYLSVVNPFFQAMRQGEFKVVTSIMTLLEVLVYPIKRGDAKLAQQYRDILFYTRGLTTAGLTPDIAEEAARLRAFHRIRAPDAIHMATAIRLNASFFLTNDMGLPSLPGLKILMLDELKTRP